MESVEGQNQPEIAPKRIKFQEIVVEEEEDRISALPDCLLLEILSRLQSTKGVIRTGTLSKRWKHLWTWVSTLLFLEPDSYLSWYAGETRNRGCQNPNSRSDFVSFVDNALTQCRQLKLKKFVVCTSYDTEFESQVNNWIRYAIICSVEELVLELLYTESEFQVDQCLYVSSSLTDLRLGSCILNPGGAISWKNLRFLLIDYVKLDEDLIENILSGSPVLETLVLDCCYGYRLLNITSKSVKKLVLDGYSYPEVELDPVDDVIAINAPNILSLTIQHSLLLWKLVLLNLSSLVEANLDYEKLGYYEITREETEEEMLKGFIQNLSHVKELKIGDRFCSEVMSRLEAKGFVFPSNIKYPDDCYNRDSIESGCR